MKWFRCLASALFCVLSSEAGAQSFNIDFAMIAERPDATYAAAGLPGVWNAVDSPPNVATALVGLAGDSTTATVSRNAGFLVSFDDPATDGGDASLFDDGLGGLGDVMITITFDGLQSGNYELTTYGWTPGRPDNITSVVLDDAPYEESKLSGGAWPGALEGGVTHVIQEAIVREGTLQLNMVGAVWWNEAFVNGVQLRHLEFSDANKDGVVGIHDFLEVLAEWGATGPIDPRDADLDDDGIVGISDFLLVLSDWG